MAVTATATETIKTALNEANPNKVADALAKIDLGTMLDPIDETITIASGTVVNLATASVAKKAAMMVQSVRVVTGTATGVRTVGDAGATASTSVVVLSADGTTLTFEAAITVARVVWLPRPAVAMSTAFAPST